MMTMKTIANEAEYNAIMSRIDELVEVVNDDTPSTDKSYVELDILVDLVQTYEKVHYKIEKPSLMDVVKLRMYEMDLTQRQVSEILEVSPSRVSEYLSGKVEPTLTIARKISKKLNINADIVLGV
jgi:HTH-type transcriptional regulator/antitoxin HigA